MTWRFIVLERRFLHASQQSSPRGGAHIENFYYLFTRQGRTQRVFSQFLYFCSGRKTSPSALSAHPSSSFAGAFTISPFLHSNASRLRVVVVVVARGGAFRWGWKNQPRNTHINNASGAKRKNDSAVYLFSSFFSLCCLSCLCICWCCRRRSINFPRHASPARGELHFLRIL